MLKNNLALKRQHLVVRNTIMLFSPKTPYFIYMEIFLQAFIVGKTPFCLFGIYELQYIDCAMNTSLTKGKI